MTNTATNPNAPGCSCGPNCTCKGKGGFARFIGGLVVGLLVGLPLGAVAPDWLKAMNTQPNKTTLPAAKHSAPPLEPPVTPPTPTTPSIDQSRPTPVDPTKPVAPH